MKSAFTSINKFIEMEKNPEISRLKKLSLDYKKSLMNKNQKPAPEKISKAQSKEAKWTSENEAFRIGFEKQLKIAQ